MKDSFNHHLIFEQTDPLEKLIKKSLFWKISFKIEPIIRFLAKQLIKLMYNIEFIGFEKLPKDGPIFMIANHVSYIDGLIINAACKRKFRFIIDLRIYNLPVVNYFMTLDRAIPIYPKKEYVTRALNDVSKAIDNDECICIFPEGHLTYTGYLSHFKPGIEWMINRNPIPIYPVVLHGIWGSIFSRKWRKSKYRYFPRYFRKKITAMMGDPIPPEKISTHYLQRVILQMKNSLSE